MKAIKLEKLTEGAYNVYVNGVQHRVSKYKTFWRVNGSGFFRTRTEAIDSI